MIGNPGPITATRDLVVTVEHPEWGAIREMRTAARVGAVRRGEHANDLRLLTAHDVGPRATNARLYSDANPLQAMGFEQKTGLAQLLSITVRTVWLLASAARGCGFLRPTTQLTCSAKWTRKRRRSFSLNMEKTKSPLK